MSHRHRPPPDRGDRGDRPEVAKSLPDLGTAQMADFPITTGRLTDAWNDDPDHPVPKRRHRHVFRWVFLAVQAIFLAWVITGAASGSGTPKACTGMMGQALKSCQDAGHAGTAIGVGLIVVVWAAVDIVLALCWLVFRRRG